MEKFESLETDWKSLREKCRHRLDQARVMLDQPGVLASEVHFELMIGLEDIAAAWLIRYGLNFSRKLKEVGPALRRFASTELTTRFDNLRVAVRLLNSGKSGVNRQQRSLHEANPDWSQQVDALLDRLDELFAQMLLADGAAPPGGRRITQGPLYGQLDSLGPCLWLCVNHSQTARQGDQAALPGLFHLWPDEASVNWPRAQSGLILPLERCHDADLAQLLLAALDELSADSERAVRPLAPTLLKNINDILAQHAASDSQATGASVPRQTIELALTPATFSALLSRFDVVCAVADRPGQLVRPLGFAPFAWRTHGELLEWLYQGLERPKALPCFSLYLVGRLRPATIQCHWLGEANTLARLPIWPADLVQTLPAEEVIEPIKVHAEVLDHGWGRLELATSSSSVEIMLSEPFDPLPTILGWIDDIDHGHLPTGIEIDEEGTIKLLMARHYQADTLLIQVRGPGYEGFPAFLETVVERRELLATLRKAMAGVMSQVEQGKWYCGDRDLTLDEYLNMIRALPGWLEQKN